MAVGMVVCRLLELGRFVECRGVWADIGCVGRRRAGLGLADMVVEVEVVVQWRIAPSMSWSGRYKVFSSVIAADSRSLVTLATLATSEDLDDGFSLALAASVRGASEVRFRTVVVNLSAEEEVENFLFKFIGAGCYCGALYCTFERRHSYLCLLVLRRVKA
ncbi:hypothetical protein Dimus_003488 [Dionaea muscipula]